MCFERKWRHGRILSTYFQHHRNSQRTVSPRERQFCFEASRCRRLVDQAGGEPTVEDAFASAGYAGSTAVFQVKLCFTADCVRQLSLRAEPSVRELLELVDG